jgi:hypothetical protein
MKRHIYSIKFCNDIWHNILQYCMSYKFLRGHAIVVYMTYMFCDCIWFIQFYSNKYYVVLHWYVVRVLQWCVVWSSAVTCSTKLYVTRTLWSYFLCHKVSYGCGRLGRDTVLYDGFFYYATAPSGPGPPHYRGFTTKLRHTTLGTTPLEHWSARRRDLYLTTHIIHKRKTSMPLAGFEPAIPASEWPHIHALHRAATGISFYES